nr:helicase protein MOM1-like isoform X1 [Tanacetum cinerariifolium]
MAERKDAPSSFLTGRKTSTAIQASTNHLNTQKSPRSEKQMGPTPSTVNIPPLNVKSTEKSADISEKSAEDVEEQKEGGSRASYKRKRYNAIEFKARYKSQRVRAETEGSVVPAHTESDAVGDGTPVANETADGNAESLYQHLKPTLSELCNILKFSEDAKIIVERFLKFVVGDFNVSKEHTSTLQALMISACWICSSLSKYTIDRKESFTLATEHLNFSCKEEEVDQVYEKLKKPKEMFLQNPMNLEVLNAFKDRASRPEEPRKSPAVPLNPQEQKRENHGVSNEEALQSSRQILVEDIARKERNEIDKFDREWNEKKMSIVNEFELEKTLIRYLYKRNLSVRSEKLNLVDKNFADELNKHEKSRQVVVNDEISLNRPANETQILDLVESEKENQERREVAHDLLGNPTEAESRKTSNDMVSDSDQMGIPAANDLTPHIEYVDGSHAVKDPNGTGPNHVAPNVESAESAGNCNQDKAPYDYSADMSHAVEDPNKNGSNDTSLHADSDQMGIPAANDLTQHIEYAEGSHAVEDPTRTGPNHGAPNVESPELGIPAGNCNPEKAHDTTPSVQQVASPVSDHSMPAITEIHNDSNLLQQPSENGIQDQEGQADPTPAVDSEDDNLQPAQMQLGQYLFDLQRNANFNQAASPRTGGVDPLHIELLRLSSVKEKMVKSHHDNIQKMNIDCEKEIAEAIAEISSTTRCAFLKYVAFSFV